MDDSEEEIMKLVNASTAIGRLEGSGWEEVSDVRA